MSANGDNKTHSAAVILTGSESEEEAELRLIVSGKTVKELFEDYCMEELGIGLDYDLFLDDCACGTITADG